MEKLELLPVSDAIRREIEQTAQGYARHLSLKTDILEVGNGFIVVSIKQLDKKTDKVYTDKELVAKAKEVFSHLPEGLLQVRIRPLVFDGVGIEAVSASWVRNNLKKYNLQQSDLCDAMGVDKAAMSKLLNNEAGFTRWHKAAFYHFFNCYVDKK